MAAFSAMGSIISFLHLSLPPEMDFYHAIPPVSKEPIVATNELRRFSLVISPP
jgi:hypothetical protein